MRGEIISGEGANTASARLTLLDDTLEESRLAAMRLAVWTHSRGPRAG